jgi:peptide/nickel transport system permease protein
VWSFILIFVVVWGVPLFVSLEPNRVYPGRELESPSFEHPLGTDGLGRDLVARVILGGRRSLAIASGAAVIAAILGGACGLLRYISERGFRLLVTPLLGLPPIITALTVLAVLDAGIASLILAVGLAQVAPYALVVGSALDQARRQSFMEGAKAVGATPWHVVRTHLLPTVLPVWISYGAVTFSYCLLNSALLNFLGITGQIGEAEWGAMLAEGRAVLRVSGWVALWPWLAISLTSLAAHHAAQQMERSISPTELW